MYTARRGQKRHRSNLNSPDAMLETFEQALEPSKTAELAADIGREPEEIADRWARRVTTEPLQAFLDGEYRFRVRSSPYNLRTIVNQVDKSHFVDMIGAVIHHMQSSLTAEQANGAWAIVAWEVRDDSTRRAARKNADNSTFVRTAGIEEPQTLEITHYEEEQFQLRVVWADLAKRPELDNWKLKTGLNDGVMADGNIPETLRKEYAEARDIIERFSKWLLGEELEPYVENVLDDRQTEEALKLLAAKTSWATLATVYNVDKAELKEYLTPLRAGQQDGP